MPMATEIPTGYKLTEFHQNKYIQFSIINIKNSEKLGHIMIKELNSKQYFVGAVSAPQGLGPLLYDHAMQYLSQRGCFLMSNEQAHKQYKVWGKTSSSAKRVWDYYEKKRPDVESTLYGFFMKKPWNVSGSIQFQL